MNGVPLHMKGVLVVNPETGDGHVKHVGGDVFLCFFSLEDSRACMIYMAFVTTSKDVS